MKSCQRNHRCTIIFKFFWGGCLGLWENLGGGLLSSCFIAFLWFNFSKSFEGVHDFCMCIYETITTNDWPASLSPWSWLWALAVGTGRRTGPSSRRGFCCSCSTRTWRCRGGEGSDCSTGSCCRDFFSVCWNSFDECQEKNRFSRTLCFSKLSCSKRIMFLVGESGIFCPNYNKLCLKLTNLIEPKKIIISMLEC